ncbi:MAG: glycosyltransferase [Rhodospirillales bacterium]
MSASIPPLVVHVFPTFAVGGAQVRFAAIANHFGAAFRHIVVALDGNFECRERLRPDLDAKFPAVDAPKGSMFGNARRFRQLLKQWRPDVLVTGNWGAIEFAMANIPPVARHIHVVDGFGPEERATQIPRRIWTRRLVLARSPVVLPSRNLVRIATEVWKLDPRFVHYVPNGIDLGRFAIAARSPHDGPPVIGTVAALRAEKNLARLIRAFARVVADTPARLTIVGDGEERAMLEALVASLGVGQHVTFAGHRSDTPALYAGFDVFALSSDTEQMPLSVIEAMASGLPVASTDVGDVRSMVAPDNDAFVVSLDDDAMADALTALLRDKARRDVLGAANLDKARRDFAEAAMFERYRALWMGEAG